MNEFLREINAIMFKQWILYQQFDSITISLEDTNENVVVVQSKCAKGLISFHEMGIIELSVDNLINGENEFYLHFQFNTFEHAMHLFEEMVDCIKNIIEKPVLKVLLSCSSGLTTSLYAEMLKEAAGVLNLDMEFNAVAVSELATEAKNYDVIMLAPQIAYQYNKMKAMLKNRLVLNIPPQIFAKYDAGAGIQFLQEELQKYKNEGKVDTTFDVSFAKHEKDVILAMGLIQSQSRNIMRLLARVYDGQNNALETKEARKKVITFDDLYDMIESILPKYPEITIISIALPGVINDGKTNWSRSFKDVNIVEKLQQKYHKKIALCNDLNAVVSGYYVYRNYYTEHNDRNLAFIYQPVGANAGIGIIQNDRLITGHKNIAGEVKFVPFDLSGDWKQLATTEAGTLEVMGKIVATTIAMNGPDLIVYYSELLPDEKDLIEEVKKYIPEEYLPEIVKEHHLSGYILPGAMMLGLMAK